MSGVRALGRNSMRLGMASHLAAGIPVTRFGQMRWAPTPVAPWQMGVEGLPHSKRYSLLLFLMRTVLDAILVIASSVPFLLVSVLTAPGSVRWWSSPTAPVLITRSVQPIKVRRSALRA